MQRSPRPIRFFLAVFALLAAAAGGRARGDDWPQWRGPHRDGVWRESGVVATLPPTLRYRWRTEIGGGFAGPAVAAGRVYVADRLVASSATATAFCFSTSTAS